MAIIFNLDKLLISRKMRSVELAKELGCTVQTVSKIKQGKVRAFRIETLDSLCAIFQCQPSDILEYMDDEVAKARFGDEFWDEYTSFYGER